MKPFTIEDVSRILADPLGSDFDKARHIRVEMGLPIRPYLPTFESVMGMVADAMTEAHQAGESQLAGMLITILAANELPGGMSKLSGILIDFHMKLSDARRHLIITGHENN